MTTDLPQVRSNRPQSPARPAVGPNSPVQPQDSGFVLVDEGFMDSPDFQAFMKASVVSLYAMSFLRATPLAGFIKAATSPALMLPIAIALFALGSQYDRPRLRIFSIVVGAIALSSLSTLYSLR